MYKFFLLETKAFEKLKRRKSKKKKTHGHYKNSNIYAITDFIEIMIMKSVVQVRTVTDVIKYPHIQPLQCEKSIHAYL